jgi:hypothetical protein
MIHVRNKNVRYDENDNNDVLIIESNVAARRPLDARSGRAPSMALRTSQIFNIFVDINITSNKIVAIKRERSPLPPLCPLNYDPP